MTRSRIDKTADAKWNDVMHELKYSAVELDIEKKCL